MVNNRFTFLLTGDLAFLYDRNALWNDHIPENLRVVVINNHGGGIFRLIEGPSKVKKDLRFFTTPHAQSIKNTVLDNGLKYYFCHDLQGLHEGMGKLNNPDSGAAVLEVFSDMERNADMFSILKGMK